MSNFDPYEDRRIANEIREKKYKDNGWTTKAQNQEIEKKEALEHIERVKTHCSHCDSTNFIEVIITVSCMQERICFNCNVCEYNNPTSEGNKILEDPKFYYQQLIKTHNIKE